MSSISLPLRRAALPTASAPELPTIDEEDTSSPPIQSERRQHQRHILHAENALAESVTDWIQATTGLQPAENHQFWLKDAKIAENMFIIHRSSKHILEFTTCILGKHSARARDRPVPVMADSDVLFMTQLSSDISRAVGGISAARHYRPRKRNLRPNDDVPALHHHHRPRKGSAATGNYKPLHLLAPKSWHMDTDADDEQSCRKCGRTDTPEWRRGLDGGLLCNVCGLLDAKQRCKHRGVQQALRSGRQSHGSGP